MIGIVHPWESGRDDSADWDQALAGVHVPADRGSCQRRDRDHIDAEERPKPAQYDRFLSIVEFGRDAGWNHLDIASHGPFFVADPGIQFILMRADRDLLALAKRFRARDAVKEIGDWIARSEAGSGELWHEELGAFCAKDLRTGKFATAITSAAALAFYAGAGTEMQRAMLANHLTWIMAHVDYSFPSLDPTDPRFEPKSCWRGPVWLVMNYMIGRGLRDTGYDALAERIRADTARLVEKSGFFEYFDPMTGEGCGGRDVSRTAAIWLAWAGRSGQTKAA